jgi:hypothetical protein
MYCHRPTLRYSPVDHHSALFKPAADRHPAKYSRSASFVPTTCCAVCGYVIAAAAWSNLFMLIESRAGPQRG